MSFSKRKVLAIIITKDIVEPECMASVLTQDYPDYDIMVHIAKAKQYLTNSDNKKYESCINQYINCPENRNKARRLALASDADYFMFVDSDTVLKPNTISLLMLPKKDAIGGYYRSCGGGNNYVAGSFVKNSKEQNVFIPFYKVNAGIIPVAMIGLGCALISRRLLEAVEFDDGLHLHNLMINHNKLEKYEPKKTFTDVNGNIIELSPRIEEPSSIMMGECMVFGHMASLAGFQLFMSGDVEVEKHLTREGHYTTIPEPVKKAEYVSPIDGQKVTY